MVYTLQGEVLFFVFTFEYEKVVLILAPEWLDLIHGQCSGVYPS
jgi:hypothetical protein